MRTDGGWPKLKAKGAPLRHLAGFAWSLAQRHLGALEAAVAQLLVQFYEAIGGPEMFLEEGARSCIPGIGLRVGVVYAQLAAQALAAGAKAWKSAPNSICFNTCANGKVLSMEVLDSIGLTLTRTWWGT